MTSIAGWDIGGAHLKVARAEGQTIVAAHQLPCALWRGLDELRRALATALESLGPVERHAVTMTGELADLFPDRATGVAAILDVLTEFLPSATIAVYTTDGEFLLAETAKARPDIVGSANWHATSRYLASRLGNGLLLDIGSTTTDVVPFIDRHVDARGTTDVERLATGELVYTGVVRTPLAAVAREVPFGGRMVGVMAEFFATAADAHRLAGTLPEGADLHATADGRGKSPAESRARLARMIGMDAGAAPETAWRRLAEAFIRRQTAAIERAIERVLSVCDLPGDASVIGAGAGRFLAEEIARRFHHPYRDFGDIIATSRPGSRSTAADIAPAVAVALLLSTA
ncbi:MAG TPA: hydantoinase/oxoprolinase family protein [Stellaceae bacterium]|nr:hydantoinase/oxoprolinase family protein [Stellaceae bacterium]